MIQYSNDEKLRLTMAEDRRQYIKSLIKLLGALGYTPKQIKYKTNKNIKQSKVLQVSDGCYATFIANEFGYKTTEAMLNKLRYKSQKLNEKEREYQDGILYDIDLYATGKLTRTFVLGKIVSRVIDKRIEDMCKNEKATEILEQLKSDLFTEQGYARVEEFPEIVETFVGQVENPENEMGMGGRMLKVLNKIIALDEQALKEYQEKVEIIHVGGNENFSTYEDLRPTTLTELGIVDDLKTEMLQEKNILNQSILPTRI